LQCHEALGSPAAPAPAGHLAVLIVGDESGRRAAAALYVTTGWDVRFAVDDASIDEALAEVAFDAVVVELEPDDPQAVGALRATRRRRPEAVRVVCSAAPAVTGDALL